MLFLMALYIWTLGIATIFPPGALTVELKVYDVPQQMNPSVMNPPPPQNFSPMDADEEKLYPLLSTGDRYSTASSYIYQ